jgi:glycerophosphoryl diester phosphodiesterase
MPSKDGVIYVCHDDNLKRTTGKNVKITKTSSKKLDKVKLKNGEKLPRLSEVFDRFGDSVFYVIETKNIGGKKARQMDKKLIKLIKKYHLKDRIMLQSQSLKSLRTVHKAFKSMPYMLIFTKGNLTKTVKRLPGFVDVVSIPTKLTTVKAVKAAHKRDIKVALYTIKNKKHMKKCMKYKPDMIFTDNVKMSRNFLKKRLAK